MKITTVWQYSLETESLRVVNTAHAIANGFFRLNNFYVLPPGTKFDNLASVVRFPDWEYYKIKRFWAKSKSVKVDVLPLRVPEYIVTGLKKKIVESKLQKPAFEGVKNTWNNIQDKVMSEIYKIIPSKKNSIKKIIIYPTVIGTTCSFSTVPNHTKEMYIYLRNDQGVFAITEAILTFLTRNEVFNDLNGNWSESELLVDWLLTKSSLHNILKKYEPDPTFKETIKATRTKQNASLLKLSEEYYKKLGINISQKVFDLKGENPVINDKTAENLTLTEKLILKLLIEKANNVASFDDLGSLLFKSVDDFSLYAISKQIERLRNKLEENGISGSSIQTLRGQGYILKN